MARPSPHSSAASLPTFAFESWYGVWAPRDTPADRIATLNTAMQNALKEKTVIDGLEALGAEPAGGSPEDFAKLMAAETAKWARIIDEAKIEKLD